MMIDYCLESGNELAVAPFSQSGSIQDESPPIEKIFGWGEIIKRESLPDGRSNIIIEGKGIARILNYSSTNPFRIAEIEKIEPIEPGVDFDQYRTILEEILILTKRILLKEGASDDLILKMNQIIDHKFPIDFLTSLLNYPIAFKQDILSTADKFQKALKFKDLLDELNLTE
jgi:ATP-dependent Lon protease